MDQNNTLTPKQALEVLAQAAIQFRGTRAEHELIERAFRTIAPLVEEQGKAETK